MSNEARESHTPGPWTWADGVTCTYAVYAVEPVFPGTLTRPGGQPVCEIPRPDNDGRGMEEAEANARLIAAAPELLARLKETEEVAIELMERAARLSYKAAIESGMELSEIRRLRGQLSKNRAAIARAEGGAG